MASALSSQKPLRRDVCDFPLGGDSIFCRFVHHLSSTIAERHFSFEVQGDGSGWSRCLIVASNYQRTWTGLTLLSPTVACALMAVSQTQPPKLSVLLRGSTRYVLGNDLPNSPMAGNTYLR